MKILNTQLVVVNIVKHVLGIEYCGGTKIN